MSQRILIVEDEADIANLVKKHLEDNRFEAVTAGTGAEAVEIFGAGRVDLVVLDLMLPDTDGLRLCRQLREKEHYVPILMLTAKSMISALCVSEMRSSTEPMVAAAPKKKAPVIR